MKKLTLTYLLIVLISAISYADPGPIGWASVNANGQDGTTGGAGGEVVTVDNMVDLFLYCSSTDPYIIQIDGPIIITPKGRHLAVNSNKTIVGITEDAGLVQGGFSVGNDRKNIIFRNLTISDTFVEGDWDGKEQDWDGIQIKGTCHHIWIDHCTFLRQGDGAVDITNGASYITISYSKFGENNKASLIGSSDTDSHTDKYKVTIHHTWFNETTQRHPRVRFGQVHLFNNYYYNMGGYGREMNYAISNGYGIGVGVNAQIYSEHNYFEKCVNPSQFYDNVNQRGYIIDIGSHLVESGNILTRPDGINWDPADHYEYTLDDAELVKEIVTTTAGAGQILTTNSPVALLNGGTLDLQCYPNPLTNSAKIVFDIPVSGTTKIILRDITGRVVREITGSHYLQGRNTIDFDRANLRAGIYLLTMESAKQSITRRIVMN
jgi:pectate lyase